MNNTNTRPIDKIEEAYKLLNLFDTNRYEAYIVGGASRDSLMGVPGTEISDIDITTNAMPEQIMALANANNINWFQEGNTPKNYGTVTLLYNNIPMQVTPFRTDENYDGRHCECKFVKTLKEDLSRRDFTINAIALDKDGYPIDYFCGIADIARRIIRAIGNPEDRFNEDKLRMIRAVRLATTLGFIIEDNTFKAIELLLIKGISKERIRDELIKILESPNRLKGVEMLIETSLLAQILPEVIYLSGTLQDARHHPEKDVLIHTMLSLKSLPTSSSLELVLSTLLHDIGKPQARIVDNDKIHFYEHEVIGSKMTEEILIRLKFKSETIDKVVWLVANHMRVHHFNEMKKSKKIKLIEHEYFDDLVELLKADIKGSSGINKTAEDFSEVTTIEKFIEEYKKELEERPVLKQKLINGYDVINAGVSPKQGILIGQILEKINDEIVEGMINRKEEALKRIQELIIVNNRYGIMERSD